MNANLLSVPVALSLLAACGGSVPPKLERPPTAAISARVVSNGRELNGRELNGRELNGRELNGRELNGRELNGRELNGRELNGTALSGAHLGGLVLDEVRLDGSELVATGADGSEIRGADLAGAVLGERSESALSVRVDTVERDASRPDVWRYTLSLGQRSDRASDGDDSTLSWRPLCGTYADGGSVQAIPLAGAWDYRQGVEGGGDHLDLPGVITFACEGAALAKCVEFGYAPWRQALRCDADGSCAPVSLAPSHEACTRMLRADYCGNGRSYTRDGELIDVYDGLGIQDDTEDWPFEAEWSADGARCLVQRRLRQGDFVPGCHRDLRDLTCGDPSHFESGTLLMTEFAPSDAN